MTSQAIKEKIEDYGYSTEVGTVTAVTGTGAISSTGGTTPEISIATADTDTTGALSDTDWDTFNNKVTNATHTGDATGSEALTVVKINGTLMSSLATGILKNTTTTGVPSIAVAGDFPTLNQNTTGKADTAGKR